MNFGYLQQVGSGLPGLAKTISRNPQIIPLVKAGLYLNLSEI